MADAVIVDDGGSTRIKRLMSGIGEMDSLLDVDVLTTPAGTRGSSHDINKSYTQALIACQGDDGVPLTKAIGPFATIEVASEMDQGVLITRTGSKLTITAFSAAADPIVEAKQHRKKRRYIVANSGPILTVKVDGTLIYDVNDPSKLPTGTNRPVIYTSVVIT